jgi:hypothetical protein
MVPTHRNTVVGELNRNLPGISNGLSLSGQEVMASLSGENHKEALKAEILELRLAGEMETSPLAPFRNGDAILPEQFRVDRARGHCQVNR